MDNYAVVKIGYSASSGVVTVAIDEKNTGEFHQCFSERITLSSNWWQGAHIGISAATGQLADNHDILAVETVVGESDPSKVAVSVAKEVNELSSEKTMTMNELLTKNGVNMNTLTEEQRGLIRVMERVEKEYQERMMKLKRELEHSLVGM